VTATAAELNLLDGVTATTAELNHVDGVTSNVQTQIDTKAPVASPTFTGTATAPTVNASTALQIGGVAVTATAAELNKMDGVTVSASDINSVTTKAPTASPTFTGDVTIPDKIVHDGDTNTAIRFADADTVTVETGGTERMRIDSSGNIGIGGTAATNTKLLVKAGTNLNLEVENSSSNLRLSALNDARDANIGLQFASSSFQFLSGDASFAEELIAKSYNETYVSLSAASSVAIDCETGNVFALTTGQNTTFTFSNPPASGTAYGFTLKLTAGGGHTITYPNTVDFAGGTAPDAPASGETDVLVFITVDGGTNWYGALAIDAAG